MNALAAIANASAYGYEPAAQAVTRSEASFTELVNREMALQDRRAALREAAEQLVSTAFITPVLGAMRDHSTAAGPFAPSIAEKRFGPLLDQRFADRVVQAANFSLIDTIVERYLPTDAPQPMLERTLA